MKKSLNTKRAIVATLKRLMESKSLSDITISEICRECGINRRTFYYHFTDKLGLVIWSFFDELESRQFRKRRIVWTKSAAMILREMKQHETFYKNVLASEDRERFLSFLWDISNRYFHIVFSRMPVKYDAEYEGFACRYFTHGYVGMAVDYVELSIDCEPEAYIQKLVECSYICLEDQKDSCKADNVSYRP